MQYLVSLCIPTNGIIEWVLPVLESIYDQKCDENIFQVVVADNGTNDTFSLKMLGYQKNHSNFVYKKTTAIGFLNQIECFKLAEGTLIKFVNHRMELVEGGLQYLIDFAKNNCELKPVTYFSNGTLKLNPKVAYFQLFEDFVYSLSYRSSWSAGLSLWNDDLYSIQNISVFNKYFPHMDILFMYKDKCKYIIDDTKLVKEISTDSTKKGRYNLFYVFVEVFLGIYKSLLRDGYISDRTYKHVKDELKFFISNLYAQFVIAKIPCSYDLSGWEKYIGKEYSIREIKKISLKPSVKLLAKKILKY